MLCTLEFVNGVAFLKWLMKYDAEGELPLSESSKEGAAFQTGAIPQEAESFFLASQCY